VRFGCNGTQGQARIKQFKDRIVAERRTAKTILEQLAKGYVEVG
jgi:predicted DNA-binding WGR domain protein